MSARVLRVLAVLAAGVCLPDIAAAIPPTVPQPVRPINGQTTNANASIFVVTQSTAPSGDPVMYDFQLYADPGLTTLVTSISGTDRFRRNMAGMVPGNTYYWRARAKDEVETSAWSPVATCVATDDIRVTKINGQVETTPQLACDLPITVRFRLKNYSGFVVTALTQGFKIYSPDGASIGSVTAGWNPATNWASVFPGGVSATTTIDNKVNFVATRSGSTGVATDNEVDVFVFGFSVSCDDIGRTVCIDSAAVLPTGNWQWTLSLATLSTIRPRWQGPLCFTIAPCCYQTRGDFDYDGDFSAVDLSAMVDYIFLNGLKPPCEDEADFDGVDGFSSVDLSAMVDYFFLNGIPPASCP